VVRTERLAAIGELSAGVAHDLRNPLGAVKNAAYFIKTRAQESGLMGSDPRIPEFQHMLWGAMTMNGSAILYTTENTVKSLLSQMESLGMDVSDYFLLDILRIYPLNANQFDEPEAAYKALGDHIQSLPDYQVIVLDSLSTFLTKSSDDQILGFFSRCKALCDSGKAIIITAHSHAFEERMLTRVRSVCDAHLRLLVEPGGSELVKTMEINKIKGAELSTGSIVRFAIEPGIGMRIIPTTTARA
jgi:flagellar protein FlaH